MTSQPGSTLTLFLRGDVMTGRGIDEALPRSIDATLHERYVKNARHYTRARRDDEGRLHLTWS